jgi:hypothetical protein
MRDLAPVPVSVLHRSLYRSCTGAYRSVSVSEVAALSLWNHYVSVVAPVVAPVPC